MNRTDIASMARAVTDLDESDVSDALLFAYIKDGYDRMIAQERAWPFFEQTYTLTTVPDERDYPLNAIGSGDLREVGSLMDGTHRLTHISYEQGEELLSASGIPHYFSTWALALNLWPAPVDARDLTVRGWRKPNSWHLSDSTEVDADERLHQPLVYFAVSMMYSLQEDPEQAQNYRQVYSEAVRYAHDDIMRMPVARPLIMTGGGIQ